MVSNGETHKSKSKGRSQQWNYLAVKKLSPLIRGIISRSYEDFSCLNCPYSFATEKKLNHIKKYLKIKIFVVKLCIRRTLKYQNLIILKSDKSPFISYADLQCIIEKTEGCKTNPENLSTKNLSKHIASGFSMYTISSFRSMGNKQDICRGKDCRKTFCESLREHAMKIINFKKKKRNY